MVFDTYGLEDWSDFTKDSSFPLKFYTLAKRSCRFIVLPTSCHVISCRIPDLSRRTDLFLVDPRLLRRLPALDLLLVEPQGDLLLGRVDAVGAVADVAADVLSLIVSIVDFPPTVLVSTEDARTIAKSPRMVPGAEASGFVAPSSVRPVLTTSRPSQTIAQTGPLAMSVVLSQPSVLQLSSHRTQRTGNETLEEGLVAQVGVVLLEVLLGGRDELDGRQLEAVMLSAIGI